MTQRVSRWCGMLVAAAAVVGLAGCGEAARSAAFRAGRAEAAPAVRAHDRLHDDVVLGRGDGARKGSCPVCRY